MFFGPRWKCMGLKVKTDVGNDFQKSIFLQGINVEHIVVEHVDNIL